MKKFMNFLLLSSCIFLTVPASAQDSNQTSEAVKNLVGGYGENHLPQAQKKNIFGQAIPQKQPQDNLYIFAPSPSARQSDFVSRVIDQLFHSLTNQTFATAPTPSSQQTPLKTLQEQAIFNALTAVPLKKSTAELQAYENTLSPVDRKALLGSTSRAEYYDEKSNKSLQQEKGMSAVGAFNLNTLLGPLQYTDQDGKPNDPLQQQALNYIRFATGQVQPIATIDLSSLSPQDLQKALGEADLRSYLISMMSYVAKSSIGTSNLYASYAMRVPHQLSNIDNKDLENAHIPQNLRKNASQLAIDQYMALRRMKDPEWYSQMETKAAPATIQREILYVLAEIRYELFMNRLINERMLATLSALQLQNLGQDRISLNMRRDALCRSTTIPYSCPPTGDPTIPSGFQ